jgi:hypothetical protein
MNRFEQIEHLRGIGLTLSRVPLNCERLNTFSAK